MLKRRTTNDIQLGNSVLKTDGAELASDDLHHALADLADLGGLSVGSLADLVLASLGETNAEDTHDVAVERNTMGDLIDEETSDVINRKKREEAIK